MKFVIFPLREAGVWRACQSMFPQCCDLVLALRLI